MNDLMYTTIATEMIHFQLLDLATESNGLLVKVIEYKNHQIIIFASPVEQVLSVGKEYNYGSYVTDYEVNGILEANSQYEHNAILNALQLIDDNE